MVVVVGFPTDRAHTRKEIRRRKRERKEKKENPCSTKVKKQVAHVGGGVRKEKEGREETKTATSIGRSQRCRWPSKVGWAEHWKMWVTKCDTRLDPGHKSLTAPPIRH